MLNFYKKNKQALNKNFKYDVLDHVNNKPFANDQDMRKVMFQEYVKDEHNNYPERYVDYANAEANAPTIDISGIEQDTYDALQSKNLQVPTDYARSTKEIPDVIDVIPITISDPDLSYREGPAPEYIKPITPQAFPGVIHGDLESLRAAEDAVSEEALGGLGRYGWHHDRNLNNHIPATRDLADQAGWPILPESESVFHKWHVKDEYNEKRISPNGHFEVVFDAHGNIVKNPESVGTYNFVSPDDKIGHSLFDVAPYFVNGNSDQDKATLQQKKVKFFKGLALSGKEYLID